MTNDMIKKTAIITGASSGIGQAAAIELSRCGYELLLCARRDDKLEEVSKEIRGNGGVAHVRVCDVSIADDVRSLSKHAGTLWPHLDLLFNNAGTGSAVSLAATSDADWSSMIGSSLTGTFHCCRELLPMLSAAPAAVIINNASVAAHRGFPDFAAYSASKGGVAAFSRAIREELRPKRIRVTTLYAGATDTPFWDPLEGEWDRSSMMSTGTIGELIAYIAQLPAAAQMEELYLMPTGGAL